LGFEVIQLVKVKKKPVIGLHIKLNDAIEKAEAKCKKIQQRIFTGLGLIIRSAESSKKGLTHLTLKRNDFFGSLFVPHPF
jgi:hypothetical protein